MASTFEESTSMPLDEITKPIKINLFWAKVHLERLHKAFLVEEWTKLVSHETHGLQGFCYKQECQQSKQRQIFQLENVKHGSLVSWKLREHWKVRTAWPTIHKDQVWYWRRSSIHHLLTCVFGGNHFEDQFLRKLWHWYVVNVSIIFDAPCLFYTNSYMFRAHFDAFLHIFWN